MSVIVRLQNLPWAANASDIRQYFGGLSIPDGGVHIVGGERGDAFIAFSTDEDARQAMLRDCGKIKEEKIKLFLSSRAEMQKIIEAARQQALQQMHFLNMQKAFGSVQMMPGIQPGATIPGLQSATTMSGMQPAPTMPEMQSAQTMPGVQSAPTMAGMQSVASMPGMQSPATMSGMQPAVTMPGMQPASTMTLHTTQGLQPVPTMQVPNLPIQNMYHQLMQKTSPENQPAIHSEIHSSISGPGKLTQQAPQMIHTPVPQSVPDSTEAQSVLSQATITSNASMSHHFPSLPPEPVSVTRSPISGTFPNPAPVSSSVVTPVTTSLGSKDLGTGPGMRTSSPPSESASYDQNENKQAEVANHDKKDRRHRRSRSRSFDSRSRSRSRSRDHRSRDRDRYYDKERRRRRSRSRERRRRRDRSRSRDNRRDRRDNRRDNDKRTGSGNEPNSRFGNSNQRNTDKPRSDFYNRLYQRGSNALPSGATNKFTPASSENKEPTVTASTTVTALTSEATIAVSSSSVAVSNNKSLETVAVSSSAPVVSNKKSERVEIPALLPPPNLLDFNQSSLFLEGKPDLHKINKADTTEMSQFYYDKTKVLNEEEKYYMREGTPSQEALPTQKQDTNFFKSRNEETENLKQNNQQHFTSGENSGRNKDNEIKYPEPFQSQWKNATKCPREVPDACIHLKHFPPYTKYYDIKQFFYNINIPYGHIKMQTDGSAYIRFKTLGEKQQAMMKNGSLLNNSSVIISHLDDDTFDEADDCKEAVQKTPTVNANKYQSRKDGRGDSNASYSSSRNEQLQQDINKSYEQAKSEQLQHAANKKKSKEITYDQCLKLEGTYVINPIYDSKNCYHERIDKFIREHNPIDMFVNRNNSSTVLQAFFKFENETKAEAARVSLHGTKIQDVFIKVSLCTNAEFAKEKERKINVDNKMNVDNKIDSQNIGMSGNMQGPPLPPPLLMNREMGNNFCGMPPMFPMAPPMFMNEMNRMPPPMMEMPNNNFMQNKFMPPPSFPFNMKPPPFYPQNQRMGNEPFRMNNEMPPQQMNRNEMSPMQMNNEMRMNPMQMNNEMRMNTAQMNNEMRMNPTQMNNEMRMNPMQMNNETRMNINEQQRSNNNNSQQQRPKRNDPRLNNNRQQPVDMEFDDDDDDNDNEEGEEEEEPPASSSFPPSRPLLPNPPMEPILNYDQNKPPLNTNCIIMQGLPFTATDKDITNFFSDIDIIPTQIHIMLDRHRTPVGDAYCEFERAEEATNAARKNNCQMGTKFIHVRLVSRDELRKALGYDEFPDSDSNFDVDPNNPSCPPPYFENAAGDRITEPDNQMRNEQFPHERRGGGNNQFGRRDVPFTNRDNPSFKRGNPNDERMPEDFGGNRNFRRGNKFGYNSGVRVGGFNSEGSRGKPPPLIPNLKMNSFRRSPSPQPLQIDSKNVEKFGKPGCVVAAENVPYNASIEQIIRFFNGFRIRPENVIRRYNDDGHVTGDARVAFDSPSDARRALKCNSRMLMGRKIKLTLAK